MDSRAHGELLGPQIRAVLGGIEPSQLGAIVAGVGPGRSPDCGSDSSPRPPWPRPWVGPPTASARSTAIGARTSGQALVATDARRKEIYWAHYVDGVRVGEPAVGHPADVAKEMGTATIAAGDGAVRYADVLGLPVQPPQYPSLPALVALAGHASGPQRRPRS